MNKTERLKKEFLELAEVVNAFDSEAVQLVIVKRMSLLIDASPKEATTEPEVIITEIIRPIKGKKFGATRALHHLLQTDYFDTPKSIAKIVAHSNQVFKLSLYSTDFSGVLLKFVSTGKLKRVNENYSDNDSSHFVYMK